MNLSFEYDKKERSGKRQNHWFVFFKLFPVFSIPSLICIYVILRIDYFCMFSDIHKLADTLIKITIIVPLFQIGHIILMIIWKSSLYLLLALLINVLIFFVTTFILHIIDIVTVLFKDKSPTGIAYIYDYLRKSLSSFMIYGYCFLLLIITLLSFSISIYLVGLIMVLFSKVTIIYPNFQDIFGSNILKLVCIFSFLPYILHAIFELINHFVLDKLFDGNTRLNKISSIKLGRIIITSLSLVYSLFFYLMNYSDLNDLIVAYSLYGLVDFIMFGIFELYLDRNQSKTSDSENGINYLKYYFSNLSLKLEMVQNNKSNKPKEIRLYIDSSQMDCALKTKRGKQYVQHVIEQIPEVGKLLSVQTQYIRIMNTINFTDLEQNSFIFFHEKSLNEIRINYCHNDLVTRVEKICNFQFRSGKLNLIQKYICAIEYAYLIFDLEENELKIR